MILDTNGLSAMADGIVEVGALLEKTHELAIPAIVMGEYKYGIMQSRHRSRYERWLETTMAKCRLLVVDEETAAEYAHVRVQLKKKGHPIPSNDLWIAALARQHALPLLSRDQHFDFVSGLRRIGW